MAREPVVLDAQQRQIVFDVLTKAFAILNVPLAGLAVSAMHAHVLARLERGRRTKGGCLITDPARHFFGIARKHASRRMSDLGVISGSLWSKGTKVVPIADRNHFLSTRNYIGRHTAEGAVVWVADEGVF
ncbi:MAG: hypothetical protein V3W34_14105 [Phycisphaerae bacterium]